MQTMTLRGVPRSIARDAWWLEGGPVTKDPAPGARAGRGPRLAWLAGLVLLGDVLFWGPQGVGVSAAIFAFALLIAALPRAQGARPSLSALGLMGLALLPVMEHVQFLSLAVLLLGLLAAIAVAHHPRASLEALAGTALSFALRYPERLVAPFRQAHLAAPWRGPGGAAGLRQAARTWALPLGGTLVFASLVMEANPVLLRLLQLDLDLETLALRSLFWLGLALMVTPFAFAYVPQAALPGSLPARPVPFGINAASVLRALVAFNLVIGVQMATDLTILVGGAALPQGITYAVYAHGGAYPLLATALLAGLFALAARPVLGEHRLIRPLMLLWLGQNIALCGSAALRLDLYVEAYGLTYLRLYAFIWMGLVAVGLVLTAWQAIRGHDTRWLLLRAGAVAGVTLYACAFVNFAEAIARTNLARDTVDMAYLCDLGPMAAGPIMARGRPGYGGPGGRQGYRRTDCAALWGQPAETWQEWGFRKWRVQRYVSQAQAEARKSGR
ncbi:DUF4173 domain-containing protein [Mesobacterium pallidum]|uniref:DUF4153 domain-containing protein n=1 Tax=Mesobacterium pallidum TaxID=2872037 RepID=UPI001EE29F07|nr:DUF4173 domain-containing protein [Mesobacterium pallidum]